MDTIFIGICCFFVGYILSIIIFVLFSYFNMTLDSKHALLVPAFVIAIILFIGAIRSSVRDYELEKIINNSNTVEEIQERTYEFFE